MDEINRAHALALWRDAKKEGMTWMEFCAWLNSICRPQPDGDTEARLFNQAAGSGARPAPGRNKAGEAESTRVLTAPGQPLDPKGCPC